MATGPPPASPSTAPSVAAAGEEGRGEKDKATAFPPLSILVDVGSSKDLTTTAPMSTKGRRARAGRTGNGNSLSNLISGELKILRSLNSKIMETPGKKRKKKWEKSEEELTWAAQLEEAKKQVMAQSRHLITNHVDYRFHSEIANQLVQDRMISDSKKTGTRTRQRPTLKRFTLGKGFSLMGSQSIMGSLKPLFSTLDVIDLSNQCIGQKGELLGEGAGRPCVWEGGQATSSTSSFYGQLTRASYHPPLLAPWLDRLLHGWRDQAAGS